MKKKSRLTSCYFTDLSVLKDGHAAGLATGDSYHLPTTKRSTHFPDDRKYKYKMQQIAIQQKQILFSIISGSRVSLYIIHYWYIVIVKVS